jgi:hypothetical protein
MSPAELVDACDPVHVTSAPGAGTSGSQADGALAEHKSYEHRESVLSREQSLDEEEF